MHYSVRRAAVHSPECPVHCVNPGCDVGLDCFQTETLHDVRARRRTGSAVPPVLASGRVAVVTRYLDIAEAESEGEAPSELTADAGSDVDRVRKLCFTHTS